MASEQARVRAKLAGAQGKRVLARSLERYANEVGDDAAKGSESGQLTPFESFKEHAEKKDRRRQVRETCRRRRPWILLS